MAKLTTWAFGKMLVDSGVMTEERLNKTHRIVIDCNSSNGVVMVYVQEYGDSEALEKLAPMLKGMLEDV